MNKSKKELMQFLNKLHILMDEFESSIEATDYNGEECIAIRVNNGVNEQCAYFLGYGFNSNELWEHILDLKRND